MKIYDAYSNSTSIDFLEESIKIAPFRIRVIKADNSSNFTNRYIGYLKSSDLMNPRLRDFDLLCQKYNIIYCLIDSGKPAQNDKAEEAIKSTKRCFAIETNLKH